jgi:hypothetical protein
MGIGLSLLMKLPRELKNHALNNRLTARHSVKKGTDQDLDNIEPPVC